MRPFKISGFIGVAVILMLVVLIFVFPPRAQSMVEGFFTPIIAYEFIQTKDEVYRLFGSEASPEREVLVRAMDRGNQLDFIYMVLYSAFLFTFSIRCSRERGKKFFLLGAVISILVLVSDFCENIQLLGITSKLETGGFEAELMYLNIFTWLKWGGIALIFLILMPYFFKGSLVAKGIALLGVIASILGLLAFIHRSVINEIFALSVGIMFFCMILYSLLYRKSVSAS